MHVRPFKSNPNKPKCTRNQRNKTILSSFVFLVKAGLEIINVTLIYFLLDIISEGDSKGGFCFPSERSG